MDQQRLLSTPTLLTILCKDILILLILFLTIQWQPSAEADETVLHGINSQVMRSIISGKRHLGSSAVDKASVTMENPTCLLMSTYRITKYGGVSLSFPNRSHSAAVDLLRMFDPITGNELKNTPVLFIDGTYTTDPGTIAEIPPEKTEYIDIILVPYRLGEVLLPPVISVVTKQGDYRQQVLPEAAMRISYLFSDPEAKFKIFTGDKAGRTPALSNTMLWAPLLSPEGGHEYAFSLPDQDYIDAFRLNISVSVSGQNPFNITELIDIKRPE
jgi:hypothetical protein